MESPSGHNLKINFDLGEAGEKEIDFEVLWDEGGIEIVKAQIEGRDALWLFRDPQRLAMENDLIDVLKAMEPDFVIPEYLDGSMKYAATLKQLRAAGACASGYNKVVRMLQDKPFTEADGDRETHIRFAHSEPISLIAIAENNGLDDALWCLRCVPDCGRDARLFAVWCARQVQHLMTDKRSIDALDVSERFADGDATEEELAAAGDAAWAAAWAAARAAAWAAAGDAAGDAAGGAARAAAWAAAGDAAGDAAVDAAGGAARAAAVDAAWDAAVDAAGATQKSMFIAMCNGEAPWQRIDTRAAA